MMKYIFRELISKSRQLVDFYLKNINRYSDTTFLSVIPK